MESKGRSKEWRSRSLPTTSNAVKRSSFVPPFLPPLFHLLGLTNPDPALLPVAQNLLNIAPKRPNWDLKRDLDRLNAKLRPQTDDAIRTLIRTSFSS